MQIGEVCSREVYVVRPGDPLVDAAREMEDHHIGSIVVVEANDGLLRPVGIVTDRDIVRGQLQRGADLFRLRVADVMTRTPLTLEESCGVAEGLERLSGRRVRRAPVVSSSGDLVGIVSFDDLLPVVAEDLSALAKLVGTQADRERPVGAVRQVAQQRSWITEGREPAR